MEATNIKEYPKFKDGDVILIVSVTRIYQLHSGTLRRNSSWFAKALDAEAPPKLTPAARREGLTPYRFELRKKCATDIGVFVRVKVRDGGKSDRPPDVFPDLDNGKVANEQTKYWDWLFGVFYNRQPAFDDTNLATVLSGCMGLVDVAESIGCVDHVRELVDLALMRQDKTLWTSIAANPTAWAELGRRVHSPIIFTEGVCHVVGKWQSMSEEEKMDLNPDVRVICERKFKELDIAKEAIEMRILGHYPTFLTRSAASKPGRPTYSNDIYMWMALCFFRQWFAQAISDSRNRVCSDGGYKFYNGLAKGGQEYLDHETFRNFHMYFPMSSKACNVLEANMGVLKEDIKPFVKDIVAERTHVNSSDYALSWLTCAVVTKEDYPWTPVEEESLFGNSSFEDGEDLSSPTATLPIRAPQQARLKPSQLNDMTNGEAKGARQIDYSADDEECLRTP